MNYLTLDDNYRIRGDIFSVAPEKQQEGKNGKSHWTARYYPNLKSALKQYLEECIKANSTVKDVLKRIAEVERKIDNLPNVIQSLSEEEMMQMQACEQGI